MRERLLWVRWMFLLIAAVVLVAFVIAQKQSADVSYGHSPSGKDAVMAADGPLTDEKALPSVAEIEAMIAKDAVVRLPGSIAYWDEKLVADAIGSEPMKILVAPPGLSDEKRDQLDDIEGADIHIFGTRVIGTIGEAVQDDLVGWRGQFATGDVTSLILTMIAFERDEPLPDDVDVLTRRAPTDSELSSVVADLTAGRPHIAQGATLESVPDSINQAFPDAEHLVAVFPRQKFGEPMVDFGPALAQRFPGQPIIVMYGGWIEYFGPQADEFAEVASASYYAQFRNRLSGWDYPQQNVLNAYLNRVTDIRYAGIFDRPLPYQPFDPLRVALPALPWLFGGCVLAFLALSFRPIVGAAAKAHTAPARLAFLNTLAIEISGLSHDPSLVRGIQKLQAASSALEENLAPAHVNRLIGEAERELDSTALELGREDLRPQNYVTSVHR